VGHRLTNHQATAKRSRPGCRWNHRHVGRPRQDAGRSGFHVTASYGTVLLAEESQDITEAMQLVDQRMYAQKTSCRRSPDHQSRDVLLRALQERTPPAPARVSGGGAR
jgi:GGDEF domain-containing protein